MSTRKSTINDINVSLEPLYLITLPGNNTLVSFDSLGNVINSDISTSTVSNFFNNTDSHVLSTILTDYDYTNSIGYILSTDTLLIALQKAQYQLDVIELSKGANNGIATLDSFGKLLSSQIPASLIGAMVYQGTWDASTNTPTLVSSTGNKGYYYIVSTPGVTNIDGISVWNANDWIVFDGSTWEKIDNSTVNVLNTPLNGLSTGINTPIISTNSILTAFQNTQAQLDNKANIINGTENYLPYFSTNNTLNTSTIYHSAISNNNGSSTLISSNNTATESLTINDFSGNKLVGIRNDGRFIFRSTSIQINDINNTESSAIYIGAGDNVYNTHFHLASRLTGTNDFMSFYNTGASLKTFYYDYNSVLNLQSINTTNSTSLLKMYKSDGTQILSFNNNGLVIGTTPQDVSSVIDLQTISQGLGMPKLLTSQKIAITTNRRGLTVYDDTLKSLSFWTGTEWASTLNNTSNGVVNAIPYYSNANSLTSSSLLYGGSTLLSLTDTNNTDKSIFSINSFGSTDNLVVSHNYTTDKTTHTYNKLNQIVANLSDGDVKIGGTSHISSISSSSDHISFTDTATNINVWRTSNTGNTFIRTTDNTATNKFFTFTNFGGTQIGYIENGGMVIGSATRNTNLTLDLQSISQAIGLPVLTTLAENNIAANSRTGMFLYNSDLSKLRYSNGISWVSVIDSSFFSSLTTNYMPKWNGTSLVNSDLSGSGGDLTLFGTGNTNRMVFATSNSPTHGGIALQTAGGTDIWSLRTNPVGGATSLAASGSMSIGGYAGSATITMGNDLSSGRYVTINAQYDLSYSTATSKTTRVSSQYGTIIGPNLVSGGNLGQWYSNNSLSNSNALSVVGGGHFTTGIVIGGNTINSVTTLDLQSTTKGLGLPLVGTLPDATSRKGNLLFDSTANILKVSNGTTYQNASFTAGTASQFVKADGSIDSNNYQGTNTTEVTTSATTLNLTASSNSIQRFTGSLTQLVIMPDATTLSLSRTFTFVNDSSAIITIQRNGGSALMTLSAGATGYVTVNNISTSTGTYYSRQSDNHPTGSWTWGRGWLNYQISYINGTNGAYFTHYNEGTTNQNTAVYRYRNNDGASTTVPITYWTCDTNGASTYVTDRPLYSFQSSYLTTGNGDIMTMYGNRVRIHHSLVVGDGGSLSTTAAPNTSSSLDLRSTTKGLGLNLVLGDVTGASGRNGLIWYDNTNNLFKGVQNSNIIKFATTSMSANTVKLNNTTSTADAVDLNIPSNTVLGRTSGNIETLSLQEIIVSTAQLVGGSFTLSDSRLTINSIATGIACSSTGIIGTAPIRWTPNGGSMLFSTGIGTDTVVFAYTIYI